MTGERKNSGIGSDARRRASSRGSSTAAQSARRRGNRRIVKSLPSRIPEKAVGLLRGLGGKIAGPARGRGLRALAATGVAIAVALGMQLAWRAVTTSPTFALDEITVTGNERASADELRALSAVEPGDNAVALDTDDVARAVEKHPWVAQARVLRRLPRGLTIEVVEHAPVALVALEHLYFVDAEGEVVKRLVPGEQESLPVITGLAREDVERGDALSLSQIRAALSFIAAWSRTKPDDALDEVHVGPSGEIAIALVDRPLRVNLGPAPWDDAIARYEGVVAELDQRALVASEIDAWSERHPERAVVRLAAAAASEAKGKKGRDSTN